MNTDLVKTFLETLQRDIVKQLQRIDGHLFSEDSWQRPQSQGGGGGRSCVIENGKVFERGGVNFSHVFGNTMPASATANRPDLAQQPFEAMGVSLVLHPENPYCPTVHLNVRFFSSRNADNIPVWWFGGGMDLTPYYPFEEDVRHFHQTCRDAIIPWGGRQAYQHFKDWCDQYFFLKHRNEARGVGGLFFDDIGAEGRYDFDHAFALIQNVGQAFLPAYLPLIEKRRAIEYGERERDFQAWRRSRYVEFNLVFDRGTLFGLQSGGRTESILMSMPPIAKWRYQYTPAADSEEAKLFRFLQPQAWA